MRARIEKKWKEKASSLASRSKWHRHRHKGEAEQSKRKNDNQNTTLASGKGSFVGRNRHRKSCAVVSFRFVYVKEVKWHMYRRAHSFLGFGDVVMDHLGKR
jgi:hypothetical protein